MFIWPPCPGMILLVRFRIAHSSSRHFGTTTLVQHYVIMFFCFHERWGFSLEWFPIPRCNFFIGRACLIIPWENFPFTKRHSPISVFFILVWIYEAFWPWMAQFRWYPEGAGRPAQLGGGSPRPRGGHPPQVLQAARGQHLGQVRQHDQQVQGVLSFYVVKLK